MIINNKRSSGESYGYESFRNEKGATSIEYALVASLISVAILGGVQLAGGGILFLWTQRIAAAVSAALGLL